MNATCYAHDVMNPSIADAYCMQELVAVEVGAGRGGGGGGGAEEEEEEKSVHSPVSPRFVSYREYLQRHHHDRDTLFTSGDRHKYHDLQAVIADHFLVLEGLQQPHGPALAGLTKKQIYMQQEHRHLGGSNADIARFNTEALKMLQSLLLFGYYHDKDKMIDAAKICFVAIKYHVRMLHPDLYAEHDAAEEGKDDDVDDDSDDADDSSGSTTSSLGDEDDDFHIGYSALVQNETPRRGEHDDWRHFMNLENEALDRQPSNDDDDDEEYDHLRSKANSDLSSSYAQGGMWASEGSPNDLRSTERPSQHRDAIIRPSTGQRSVATAMTDKNHRGLYITRLCLRHDEAKQASVYREHVRQNQR